MEDDDDGNGSSLIPVSLLALKGWEKESSLVAAAAAAAATRATPQTCYTSNCWWSEERSCLADRNERKMTSSPSLSSHAFFSIFLSSDR